MTPDDHYYPNTTCLYCHNLQHYLLNITKYFTTNTQLLFLPGLHHLHTDLIIQNVHNISLIGYTTDGTTPDTVIQCNSLVGIVMTNISTLIVTNIKVRSCLGKEYNNATVLIKQCTNVQLRHVVIEENHNSYGIVGINILGDSCFSYITNNVLNITYSDTTVKVGMENHTLTIDHYQINFYDVHKSFQHRIAFNLYQQFYRVNLCIFQSTFKGLRNTTVININLGNKGVPQNTILVKNCQFSDSNGDLIDIKVKEGHTGQRGDIVKFHNCEFFNIGLFHKCRGPCTIFYIQYGPPYIEINGCSFHHTICQILYNRHHESPFTNVQITIANTTFTSSSDKFHFIRLSKADLYLIGPVVFYNITKTKSVVLLMQSNVTCINYIEFALVQTSFIWEDMYYSYQTPLFLDENSIINVSHCMFEKFAQSPLKKLYPPCYFQYLSGKQQNDTYNNRIYAIIFENNKVTSEQQSYNNLPITHCSWLPQSAFNTTIPLEVNKKYIKYINSSGTFDLLPQKVQKNRMCYCTTNISYDCYKDIFDPVYPGQTMTLNLYMDVIDIIGYESPNIVITVTNDVDWLPPTACGVTDYSAQIANRHTCNALEYSISFPNPNYNWCELFLKGYYSISNTNGIEFADVYYINQRLCPVGFNKSDGICKCHQFLDQFNIKCNINDQTILRPANIWISHISSYNFSLSLHCPFHYCLSHSSHLNFSTPNSQCQFNRSGILCGHCQHGLSTVFGSSDCQKCSNIYLFLIVPIAIAGLVLVLLLFILNLTVADGTINAFILYVNIISINTPVFFPQAHFNNFSLTYTFISLANLDLGIQTCFYNGMDDYAKMWLQLAFPFYLIFIATSLLITSHYSTTIQRLTAGRTIPVLATLFLLSYTKLLLIVSRALFFYTKIVYLPSKHTTLVWSVDANVPLFGVRFTILFAVCLILFLILLPFNVIMLITRALLKFRIIRRVLPLLDAFQGPYKIKLYYWTGVQLVIRVVFYGISTLDRNINLTIGVMLLSIIGVLQGILKPFNHTYKNYQELALVFNLQWLFVMSLYSQENTVVFNIIIGIAAVHFSLIIAYHVITYGCGEGIRKKIKINAATLSRRFTTILNRQQVQQIEIQQYDNNDDECKGLLMDDPVADAY